MSTLRVMTFNVRFGTAEDGDNRWELRRDLVYDVIVQAHCELACLQEVMPFQLAELEEALPGYARLGEARYAGGRGAHAPIFFRADALEPGPSGDFWLSETPDVPGSKGWDAAVARICSWATFRFRQGGARFAVFNTHFDQRGEVARLRSAELLVRRMRRLTDAPRLLVGDLNAAEDTEPLRVLRESGLQDSFRVVVPEGAVTTFHGFRELTRLGKIDYVLCDGSWTVRGAEIVRTAVDGRYPSDHFPVVAELSLEG